MRFAMDEWAQRGVRWWVFLYTSGLPADLRDSRRAEIESDLWEQGRDALEAGRSPWVTAIEVLARWFMGIPADLSWRIELIRTSGHGDRVSGLKNDLRGRTFIGAASLMAALTVGLGVAVALGMFESHVYGHDVPRAIWGIVGPSAGAIVLAGLAVGRRLLVLGDVLVIGGTFPLAAILVWTIIAPSLWLLLVTFFAISVLRFPWWNRARSL